MNNFYDILYSTLYLSIIHILKDTKRLRSQQNVQNVKKKKKRYKEKYEEK